LEAPWRNSFSSCGKRRPRADRLTDEPRTGFPGDAAPPEARSRWRRFTSHPLFYLLLFLLTFVTTTLAGGAAFTTKGGWLGSGRFSDGFSFSIPVMTILLVHEAGHYLMCRRYGLASTLPIFLPSPVLFPGFLSFGTFGALIRIKEPIPSKRVLLDIGAAGPLAGFVATIPFLLYGVAHASPTTGALTPNTILFDYPLLVRWAQRWMHVEAYTSASVHEHPTFMAAWFGLLVTAMNLFPIGQLDGSHVMRALLGRRQPLAAGGAAALALAGALAGPPVWLVFAVFATLFMGLSHPPMPDDDEPLDFGRSLVALACVAVFLLSFSLTPLRNL
jgi:membrane-associated protease RseP (regulator of RpoE activity)